MHIDSALAKRSKLVSRRVSLKHLKSTNEPTYETERELCTDRTDSGCQGGGAGGRMQWEVRASKYKLPYAEWISNKVLLQSTENYVQYPMINCHDGKEYIQKKECIHTYN